MRIELAIDNLDTLDNGGPTRFSATDRSFEIGRAPTRDFVLPDPERVISSRHCEVRFEDGGFLLVDHSTNGTFVNGSDSRLARPKRLATGDRLQIGRYVLVVRIEEDAGGWGEPLSFPTAGRRGEPPGPAMRGQGKPAPNPWAIDEPVAPPVDIQPPPRPNPPAFEGKIFDLDTRDPQARPRPGGAASPDRWDGPDRDPWSQDRDGPPERQAGIGEEISGNAGFDPRHRLGEEDDDPFEINEPAADRLPPRQGIEAAGGPASEARRSLAMAPPDQRTIESLEPPPSPATAQKAAFDPPGSSRSPAEAGHLLSVIAEAAGLDPRILAGRPPEEAAREIGALLSVSARGVGDLLRMRAKAKTLTRSAERTTIEVAGNNALKFSPTPEAALARMFGSEGPGYLPAQESFEEAFRDLSEHELITFAAMQKALKRLIDDLSPEAVMARVPASVVPFSRKAQAWDVFINRWDAKTEPFEHGMLDVFLQYFREIYDDSARARRR